MSLSDEFVRRLASVKCSESQHPVPPAEPRSTIDIGGYPAPMSDNLSPEQRVQWQSQLSVYHKELSAQCPFCIARATLEKVK